MCVALCGVVRGCLYSAAQAGVGWGGLGADLRAEVYGGAPHIYCRGVWRRAANMCMWGGKQRACVPRFMAARGTRSRPPRASACVRGRVGIRARIRVGVGVRARIRARARVRVKARAGARAIGLGLRARVAEDAQPLPLLGQDQVERRVVDHQLGREGGGGGRLLRG